MALEKTRNEIIEAALELIGVYGPENSATDTDISRGATALDRLVKTWQARGAHLWARNEARLFLQPNQKKYQLGDSSPDHATEDPFETYLAADAASGATTITPNDLDDMTVGDNIGIQLDDGTLQWTTIDTITDPTIDIADALTDDAAANNVIYFYTTDLGKALRIPDARRRDISGITGTSFNPTEVQLQKWGREDYLNQTNKDTTGTPTLFYYDPKIDSGFFYLWATPSVVTLSISFTYLRPLDVFDNSSSAPDFPDEWVEALVYNLAVRRAPAYGMVVTNEVKELAISLYQQAMDWDQDMASVVFKYDSTGAR